MENPYSARSLVSYEHNFKLRSVQHLSLDRQQRSLRDKARKVNRTKIDKNFGNSVLYFQLEQQMRGAGAGDWLPSDGVCTFELYRGTASTPSPRTPSCALEPPGSPLAPSAPCLARRWSETWRCWHKQFKTNHTHTQTQQTTRESCETTPLKVGSSLGVFKVV